VNVVLELGSSSEQSALATGFPYRIMEGLPVTPKVKFGRSSAQAKTRLSRLDVLEHEATCDGTIAGTWNLVLTSSSAHRNTKNSRTSCEAP
jgi:hypothetical protein